MSRLLVFDIQKWQQTQVSVSILMTDIYLILEEQKSLAEHAT